METETTTISPADVAALSAKEAEAASGEGAAYDASVKAESNISRLERELFEARASQEAEFPQRRVDAAQRAVDKAEEALAGAKDALDQAIADNKAEEEGREAAEAERAERKAKARAEAEAEAAAEAAPADQEATSETEGK